MNCAVFLYLYVIYYILSGRFMPSIELVERIYLSSLTKTLRGRFLPYLSLSTSSPKSSDL
jgi:hypothetical protein